MGNTYNRIYIWCCKYGGNRYCERCANKKWCASRHTGLLNSCLGKLCLHPYLVVPLISARVSAHCQAILLVHANKQAVNPHYSPRWVKLHWDNEWWLSEKIQLVYLAEPDDIGSWPQLLSSWHLSNPPAEAWLAPEWGSEWLNLMAFLGQHTVYTVYSPYKPCNHSY